MDDKPCKLRLESENYTEGTEGGFGYQLWLSTPVVPLDIMVSSVAPLQTAVRHLYVDGVDPETWEPARIGCERNGEVVWNRFYDHCKLVYQLERDGKTVISDHTIGGRFYVNEIDSWEEYDRVPTPSPKDKPAFTRWCVEQSLVLLESKEIHDIDGWKCPYQLRHAARDLVESHPELIQPLVDVEDSDVIYDLAMSYAEGTVIGARDLQTPAKEYLNELTTCMAIDVVICYASTSDEVKALDKERRAIMVD